MTKTPNSPEARAVYPVPCHFCATISITYVQYRDQHQVQCSGCGASGPLSKTREKALEAWNTRPAQVEGLGLTEEEREAMGRILSESWEPPSITQQIEDAICVADALNRITRLSSPSLPEGLAEKVDALIWAENGWITPGALARLRASVAAAFLESHTNGVEGWRPIESAPRDGTEVCLWWPYMFSSVVVGHCNGGGTGWWVDGKPNDGEVPPTHWMPLPPKPSTLPHTGAKG